MAYTTISFIEKAHIVHNGKYLYHNTDYTGAFNKIVITCPIHGDFTQQPSGHLYGYGCKKCGRDVVADKLKTNVNDFIKRANVIHNHKYDYSNISYVNTNTSISIKCPHHGEFNQIPNDHLTGYGCSKCAVELRQENRTFTTDDFINKSILIHGEMYNYSKSIYTKGRNKIMIICPTHGEFDIIATTHLQGAGCPHCHNELRYLNSLTQRTANFIQQAQNIHNYQYDYTKIKYVDSYTKVIIECPIHGEFFQTPMDHLQGCGCKKCGGAKHSKMGVRWLDTIMLNENIFIQHAGNVGEYKIPNTNKTVDGYCTTTNTIYEFHGDFFHGNPSLYDPEFMNPLLYKTMGELYEKTIAREQHIKNLGYNLVVMWESDYKKQFK